jgi:hypothetical protein
MAKATGKIGAIQAVFNDAGKLIGFSDPSGTGDGVDFAVQVATYNSAGTLGVYTNPDGTDSQSVKAVTGATYNTVAGDKILSDSTSTNITVTVVAGTTPDGLLLQQLSTGTVTVTAGDGVTFIPSGNASTTSAGDYVQLQKTAVANTFLVVES